jgi:NNP family nitrate/nitrite transporter-like MFS transporter
MMNIFARAVGGVVGDWAGGVWGLRGRSLLLGFVIFAEGVALTMFSHLTSLASAATAYLLFGLLVCMACGVTYAVVPFVRPRAIGSVSGIVGAGGNVGAVCAGFLFKAESLSGSQALSILGIAVAVTAFSALLLRFQEDEVPLAMTQVSSATQLQTGD